MTRLFSTARRAKAAVRASLGSLRPFAVLLALGMGLAGAASLSAPGVSHAQIGNLDPSQLQNVDPSLLRQFRERQSGPGRTSQDVTSPVDSVRTPRPAAPGEAGLPVTPPTEKPSPLELDYAERLALLAPDYDPEKAGEGAPTGPVPLRQFGYRMLDNLSVAGDMVSTGAINDSYRLGVGDELVITFRGQKNESFRTAVDREGQVVLPELPPIQAAGREVAHFRAVLEQVTAATFLQTEVFVSVGNVRNFPIVVLGQVNRPGVHRVTGVASVLDAIVAAGGVQKTGSLRNIRLIRGNQYVTVDLYELLLTGLLTEDLALMEGDRVFVPPIGPTFAVAGDVQRPGIYELPAPDAYLTAGYAIGLAGGTLRPEGYRFLLISTELRGGDQIAEIADIGGVPVKSSDVILVNKTGYSWDGAFYLDGNVSVPGPRSLRFDHTVGSVINAPDTLLEDPYLLFAVIESTDTATRARLFQAVDLGRIVKGQSDVPLRTDDRLLVFSADDIRFLSSPRIQAILRGDTFVPPAGTPRPESCRSLDALASVVSRSRSERFAKARLALNPDRRQIVPPAVDCPQIFERYPKLLAFVLDYVVSIGGEIRLPGIYPIAAGTSLGALVPILGGLSAEADLGQIELTRFRDADPQSEPVFSRQTIDARQDSLVSVALVPGDIVRFSPKFSERDVGSVLLAGEFKRPGVYQIRKGERMSELIARAGGITEQAYPLGAVFTRERARRREAEGFQRAALDLESGLAEALASGALTSDEAADPQAVVLAVQGLAERLRNAQAVGRVVVEADPTVLDVRRELDTILEPGDRLIMPKRPNSVTVSGEVLNAGTIQFISGKTVDQYIENAGGISRVADDGRIFVILPNGEAQTVSVVSFEFEPVRVPPGSTIVVPRDPKPFDLLAFSVSLSEILSRLAITAASLAVIQS